MNKDKTLKILKIVSCALLALAFAVGMFSLIFDRNKPDDADTQKDQFDTFTEFSDPSNIRKCVYSISYTEGALTLDGNYVAVFSNESGKRSVTLEYKYDKLSEIGASDDMIVTVTDIVTRSGDEEIAELFGDMNLPYGIFIKKEDFAGYEISDNRLVGEIRDGSLGQGTHSIVFTLDKDAKNQQLTAFWLVYTEENGASVNISCKIEYKN